MLRLRWHRGRKTHAAVAALLLLLTALFAALLAVDSRRSHAGRRALWLSVLMGAHLTLKVVGYLISSH